MEKYILCIDVYEGRYEERNCNTCFYVHVGARAGRVPSRITEKLRCLLSNIHR
jgi:hypothetical protein